MKEPNALEYSRERAYLHDVKLNDVYLCGVELEDVSEQLKSILLAQHENEG